MSTSPNFFDRQLMKSSGASLEQLQQGKSGLKDFFLGTPQRFEQLPTGTQGQQDLIQQLIQGLGGGGTGGGPLGSSMQNLQQLLSGDPQAFEAFQAPAMRQFNEQIVPGIAERFTNLGAGAQGSSAFEQSLGQAGAGLSERLSAQRANLQSGAMNQLQSLLQSSQQPQFQNINRPQQAGLLQMLLPILMQMGTSAAAGGISNLSQGLTLMGGPKSTLESQGVTRTRLPLS